MQVCYCQFVLVVWVLQIGIYCQFGQYVVFGCLGGWWLVQQQVWLWVYVQFGEVGVDICYIGLDYFGLCIDGFGQMCVGMCMQMVDVYLLVYFDGGWVEQCGQFVGGGVVYQVYFEIVFLCVYQFQCLYCIGLVVGIDGDYVECIVGDVYWSLQVCQWLCVVQCGQIVVQQFLYDGDDNDEQYY